ncbi:UDP-glucose 4-epimerase [Clostridium zeae]|uniref:UDP-glucose 4-epimerase n=1 Tax=Clostridium zeae TaxID=2759022 RepID=A0ABQ1EDH1_9CLOT|nr:UDP-glucose 4-epimerase GalE [Clostridium zeae]GFZ32810.1 UDP-glucose 4-epimerase [Clostridium zeae]
MKVLVTGGAGYIGSTICSALIDNGHEPIILDSLVTGREEFTKGKIFYQGDIADRDLLETIFSEHPDIHYTIHCAALIVVPESVESPYEYYRENVGKSLELFHTLNRLGCKNVVFSSSASIYDDVPNFMVTEEAPLNARSPYARTKYMMEMILKDFCFAYGMKGIALRYFNPIGADPKMRSGVHVQFPSHVLGKLVDVARGNDPVFKITGVNWETRDGSGVRDFVHVWDLALAHVKAVERFEEAFKDSTAIDNYLVINLGSGDGVTVKELVKAFENVYGKEINKEEAPPRPGDVPGSYANADRAKKLLGWQSQLSIEQGIADALKWGEIRETIIKY